MRHFAKLATSASLMAMTIALAACAAPIAQQLDASTPIQVTSLKAAVAASAAAKRVATVYIEQGHLTAAQLTQIDALRAAEEATLAKLEDDQVHGRSLVFDVFNAELAALQAFSKPT